MKQFYGMLVVLLLCLGATGQNARPCSACLPQGIEFTTQSQVDNFRTNYPGCTQITGDVVINGGTNISNLNGLSMVTSLGGNLNLVQNNSLSSLSGLKGLTSVGYWLNIVFNPSLRSLSGLDSLNFIGGGLVIQLNDSLKVLAGLEGLDSLGGVLRIVNNVSLISLEGLDNLDAGSINELQITGNTSLSGCEAGSICSYLANPGGTIDIQNNAPGCNSPGEVTGACAAMGPEPLTTAQHITIRPNPVSSVLVVEPREKVMLDVFYLSGQLLMRQEITLPRAILDVSEWESGIYMVRLAGKTTMQTLKLIKK